MQFHQRRKRVLIINKKERDVLKKNLVSTHLFQRKFWMPAAGFEPAWISPLDFESRAYAVSPRRLIQFKIIQNVW